MKLPRQVKYPVQTQALLRRLPRVRTYWRSYDRTASMYNGTIMALPDASGTYTSPPATIFINQATSGAVMDSKFITPTPAWSLVRGTTYGFGRMELATEGETRTLRYAYVSTTGAIVDKWAIVKSA